MKRELIESYYDMNEKSLEAFIKSDPYVVEMETEYENASESIQPVIDTLGHDFWTMRDWYFVQSIMSENMRLADIHWEISAPSFYISTTSRKKMLNVRFRRGKGRNN